MHVRGTDQEAVARPLASTRIATTVCCLKTLWNHPLKHAIQTSASGFHLLLRVCKALDQEGLIVRALLDRTLHGRVVPRVPDQES